MAGVEDVYHELYTVSPNGFFPTSDAEKSWLPLTTPFTYAPGCTDNWRVSNDYISDPDDIYLIIASSCTSSGGRMIHSPGTCLSGHTMANLVEFRTVGWTTGGLRAWGAECCSSGFTAQRGFCTSVFSTPVTAYDAKEFFDVEMTIVGEVTTLHSFDEEYRGNSTVLTTGIMTVDKMMVYWQESDFSKFDHDYASSLAEVLLPSNTFTPTATATATDITSETASPPDRSQLTSATSSAEPSSEKPPGPSRSGLSHGAKAGIGVGTSIGAILLFVAGFLLHKRRLRKKAKLDQETAKQNEQPEFVPARENEA